MDFGKAYNRTEFVNFLRRDFLPEDFEQQEQNLPFYTKPQFAKSAIKLGKSPSLDLVVYEIRHSSKNDARVGLSKDAFRLLASEKQSRALVIFVPDDTNDNYRFSLIEISLTLADDDSRVTRTYSNPRRFSYYLGKGIATYTPNKYLNELGRVSNIKDLFERFSVEVLTKAFYNELSDWYAWAIKIIKLPNDIRTTEDDQKYNHEGAIRLITRLIFVWFLKQRGLIPWQFFDQQYIADYLIEGFNPQAQDNLFGKSEASHYYKAILQNLFFAMLNSPICKEGSKEIDQRRFSRGREDFDNNKLMRYKSLFKDPDLFLKLANEHVPFLNGGLFDCLDDKRGYMYYDGFSERKESQAQLCVPDYLFFGEEAGKNIDLSEFYGDANKKKVSARGIIDILKRYNFTVEENMPFDKDVSLDPELLGKVFENLLASYNPETQQTARRESGSYYTPREIVQYMVDESLVAHLKRTVSPELEKEYRKLLSYNDDDILLSEHQKSEIMQSLYNCKILDPACGSGAFPVGILQQMVHILTQIDPDNSRWKEMLFRLANDESSEAFKNSTPEERQEQLDDLYRSFNDNYNRPDYSRKLYLIENCIYGVDIQPIAIQISKLRFFISLVVDQNINDDPTDNFGIRPLPNLEAKFVAANSLVGLKREGNIFDTDSIKGKEALLKIAKHKIFGAKTSRTKEKYREQVRILRSEIANMLVEQRLVGNSQAQQLKQWDMFDQNSSAPFFDIEWMFDLKDGFDIIIANPPYVKEYTSSSSFDGFRETSPYYMGKMDLWYGFACHSVDILKNGGYLCFIATNNWTTSAGADILRNKIVNDCKLISISDFGSYLVFGESASIQTMILLLEKNSIEDNFLVKFNRLNVSNATKEEAISFLVDVSQFNTHITTSFNRNKYRNKLFTFSKSDDSLILDKMTSLNVTYLTSKEVGQGIIGAPDDCFIVKDTSYFSNEEQHYLKPYFTGLSDKYKSRSQDGFIIYLSKKNFKYRNLDLFPNFRSHFAQHEHNLRAAKIKFKTPDKPYYFLHREREEVMFADGRPKLICQARCLFPRFFYTEDAYYASRALFVIQSSRLSLKYLNGLFNSKLIEFWLRNRGKIQGNSFQIDKGPITSIPIIINEKISLSIETIVDEIYDNINSMKENMNRIDLYIYKAYELSYDEILIVDPETPITREDYDNFKI